MQKRHLWLILVITIGVVLGFWWSRRSASTNPLVAQPPKPTPRVSTPAAPAAPIVAKPAERPSSRLVTPVAAPVVSTPATRPQEQPAPGKVIEPLAPAPTAVAAAQPPAKPEVKIEENQTIDFSGGEAVTKNSAEEKAIIAKAVKEMDDAVKNITFGPIGPASASANKAEPSPAPSK